MLADALVTYVAAIGLIAVATALGAGILAAAGARRLSPVAPVVGLAAASALAWWAVRLPGHGLTALLVLLAAAAVAGALAATRLGGIAETLARMLPAAVGTLAAVSIPFVVEGHIGVLGSGFNVDMSQHLFAASWLLDQEGLSPSLVRNGYPLGPHALAVTADRVTGELSTAFTAVTIAVPVAAALAALAALGRLPRLRASVVAVLSALAYLVASYLAQGAFKELFEAAFLLGFALWLRELTRDRERTGEGLLMFLPGAVIAAGALYVYSWPGLVWLGAAAVVWALVELRRRRVGVREAVPRFAPAALVGLLVLGLAAAPELDRIGRFGTSVDAVTERTPSAAAAGAGDRAQGGGAGQGSGPSGAVGGSARPKPVQPDFDNDLGNLFGQINPASVFGVWPSGDFRVNPGDGAVPAPVFWLGALLGAVAFALGAVAAWRRAETAILAALAAAAAIWLGARIGSTPYTSAKALQMLAPLVMLLAAGGLLDRAAPVPLRTRHPRALAACGAAFALAAAASSVLALANAPVGPDDYTPGVRKLAKRFAGEPTLLLAPATTIADQHGADFYGWELRGAASVAVEPLPAGGSAPAGIARVLVVGGDQEPPFDDVKRINSANRVVLWRVLDGRPHETGQ
ncbi:MAG: hypothetical protein R2691_03465 [Solirubrobacterales bacterium]